MQLDKTQRDQIKAENAHLTALTGKICTNPKKPYFVDDNQQIVDLHLMTPEQIHQIYGENK